MPLPDDVEIGLRTLLKDCTALVRIDDKPRGTAFFINENLLLTCRHVVKDLAEVQVEPFRRTLRVATVVTPSDPDLDLALLEVESMPDEAPQPCVLLDGRLDDDTDYYLAGYPKEDGAEAGLEVFKLEGHLRELPTGAVDALKLEAGKQVTWGLSGGPVLSMATGAVSAVMRTSNDPVGALGGGAVPIIKAAEAFEEVRRAVATPPLAVRRWRDALGKQQWQQSGRIWDMQAQVDLTVSGSRNKWSITIDPSGAAGEFISGADLGDDVTEAMFRWAQGRRISVKEEVHLLGRLLAGALFPSAVAAHLQILSNADEVLVRLHVDRSTNLVDIPWELAAVPGKKGRFLATDKRFRFVRIENAAKPAPPPTNLTVNVLGVMGLPPRWEFPTIYGETPVEWPKLDEICNKFQQNFSETFSLDLLRAPEAHVVRGKLESRRYDVLHYIGVGRLRGGQAQLSLVDAGEGVGTWHDIDQQVFDWVEGSGVRLVVLEFTSPPADQVFEPVSQSSLGNLLRGGVDAVVFTRFPVHPRQFRYFNETFYDHLRLGDSVETSVQASRAVLETAVAIEDSAGFGWFTLVTGPRSDVRLVPPRVAPPQAGKTKVPTGRDARDSGDQTRVEVTDVFGR